MARYSRRSASRAARTAGLPVAARDQVAEPRAVGEETELRVAEHAHERLAVLLEARIEDDACITVRAGARDLVGVRRAEQPLEHHPGRVDGEVGHPAGEA